MDEKKVITDSDIEKLRAKNGEVIDLPGFDEKTPFNARVKRPSLMELCAKDIIPNALLAEAQQLFEGDLQKGTLLKYNEIMRKVAEVALVEPTYESVKDILTDEQIVCIFDYSQKGVVALAPFRAVRELLQKTLNSGRTDKGKTIRNVKGRK